MSRLYTCLILEKVDEGALDARQMLQDALGWMSEDDVKSLCERLDITLPYEPNTCAHCDQEISEEDQEAAHHWADDWYHEGECITEAQAQGLTCAGCHEAIGQGDDIHKHDGMVWHMECWQECEHERIAAMEGHDPYGDRDPTPEEQAGWAMQDKIDMYRNEY